MGVSIFTRQAYTEVDNFIDLLDEYNKNKIPKKLREYFKKNKDVNYIKNINPNQPIQEQSLMEETLALIAMLNLQYWCEDDNEKERLKNIYAKNENKYQEELREKYNHDNLFKNKQKETTNNDAVNETAMVEYKNSSLFVKIKNLIKKIIKIK